MIVVIVLVLVFVALIGYQKFRGMQALTFTHIDISGLELEEIVAIGTKASGSLAGRLMGGTPTARRVNDQHHGLKSFRFGVPAVTLDFVLVWRRRGTPDRR